MRYTGTYIVIRTTRAGDRRIRQAKRWLTRGKDIIDHALTGLMAGGVLTAVLGGCAVDSADFAVPLGMVIGGMAVASLAGLLRWWLK